MCDQPLAEVLVTARDAAAGREVARLLEGAGFAVHPSADAAEALRRAAGRPDLTVLDLRRAEAEGLPVLARLEAVGRLAGGVAHEFNNLLVVINGYSEMLLDDPQLPPAARDALAEIRKAGERAASLTRQLLAFGCRQLLAPVVLDLNALLAGLEELLRRLMGPGVAVAFLPDPGLGPVRADPSQLEQVVLNLCLNARDAMPQGGTLTLQTRSAGAEAGRWVALDVRDTGPGMDEQTRARLFEPFFTTKELGRGTGLGLAVVHGIVTQSGGRVLVDSRPDQGTTFTVLLPRAAQNPIEDEAGRPV